MLQLIFVESFNYFFKIWFNKFIRELAKMASYSSQYGTKSISNLEKFRPLVLCGPSGSGKSTMLDRILLDFPGKFGFSVSHTTRSARKGEIDGQHYFFVTHQDMETKIKEGVFIETAQFSGNTYGTSKASVEKVASEGKICILDIETRGVRQVKQSSLNPWYVFIRPPSLEALETRLILRMTETPETLKKRLRCAVEEIQYGTEPGNFHIVIVNDDLEVAYNQLKDFIAKNVIPKESCDQDKSAGDQNTRLAN